MSERPSQDFYLRLDNTAIIKLLTGCAAAFAERGLLSSHDAEDFRIALSGLQNEPVPRPLLIALNDQRNEFLTMLFARYGQLGFCQNTFRYTAQLALRDSSNALGELGDTVLNKAKALFNRPFYVYFGGVCERRTLFSSVLVELAETIAQASQTLEQANQMLSVLFPASLSNLSQEDLDLDRRIAQDVGFSGVADDAIGFYREETARALIVGAFVGLTTSITDFIGQLKHNKIRDDTTAASIICESLQADVQLINTFAFPKTSDLAAWEMRREGFLRAVRNLNFHIRALTEQFHDSLTKLSNIQGATRTSVPEDVLRGMSTAMIKDGTAPLKAVSAACALVRYCDVHNVDATKILPAELAKIDPNLSTASLEILQAGETRPLESNLKEQTLKRQQTLLKRFHAMLAQAGVLLLPVALSLSFYGCGVKMTPKSDLIDYRPSVDYHSPESMPDYLKQAQKTQSRKKHTPVKEENNEEK